MNIDPNLQITVEGNRAHITVTGKGTVRQAAVLKRFYQNALLEGIDDFTLELKECTTLDNTFLGVVLSMALKLKARNGQFRTRNAHEDVVSLMASLGVDRLFSGRSSR